MTNYNNYAWPTMASSGQQQFTQVPNTQTQNNSIIWVQGVEGAKAYPIAPGSAVSLWDSEAQTIYIKMADASGVPQPLRILDYTERVQTPEVAVEKNYVTADDVSAIMDSKISALTTQIEQMLKNQNNRKKGGWDNGKSTVQSSKQN